MTPPPAAGVRFIIRAPTRARVGPQPERHRGRPAPISSGAVAMLDRDEREFVTRTATPERVQEFLDTLAYNWEPEGVSTLRSLRRVLRDRTAHCLEGAVAAAAILGHHGHRPWMLYMDALDICHAAFLYCQRDPSGRRLWGTVAMSRDENLKGRPPIYASLHDLTMSYYPHYWNSLTNDRNDLSLRGFSVIDLARFGLDLETAEPDLLAIEDSLWRLRYRALFPASPTRRNYRLVGQTTEIEWR